MTEQAARTLRNTLMRKADQVQDLDIDGARGLAHEIRIAAGQVQSAGGRIAWADALIARHPKRKNPGKTL